MYGWRARVGLILPSTNTVMESEFWRMVPEGVTVHTARMKLTETTPETLNTMSDHIERAADELATDKVDVIIFGCTSGSFVGGIEWESKIVKRIRNATGIAAITTSGAALKALRTFTKKRISIATPYIEELNRLEKKYFEANGFEVVSIKGLGYSDNIAIGKLSPSVTYVIAKEVVKSETEVLFISCTDFRSIELLSMLEKDIKRPVISSNQSSLWAAFKESNVDGSIEGFGSLFSY